MDYLDAVNYVLNQIGSPGVTEAQPGLPEYDAAVRRLAEASVWVQKRGYWFNTETNVSLEVEANGTIILPTNLLKILNSREGFMLNIGGLAYNPNTQSNDWSQYTTINVSWILEQPWERLPDTAQDVIRIAAAQEMITIELEDIRKADLLSSKYRDAFIDMKKDDLEVKKRTKLSNVAFVYTRGGVRPYNRGGAIFMSNHLGPSGSSSTSGAAALRTFDSVAQMALATAYSVGDLVQCSDYAPGKNAGLMTFVAVPTGTSIADGGTFIDGVGVQWHQLPSEMLTVKQFGAVGDGVTNSNAALLAASAAGEAVSVPAGKYVTTENSAQLTGKWVGEGQIVQTGVATHAPNLIIATSEPSPRATAVQAASATTAFIGDQSKAFQPLEVRIIGADTLGNPVSEPALQTGFKFCEELFPYNTHIVNAGGYNYAHNGMQGRSSVGAIRIVGTHTGGGGMLPISTATWASGTRGPDEAAAYGNGQETTSFLANPAAAGGNFSASAGSDAVYLNPLEVNCVDNPSGSSPKDVAAMGAVINMIRDHDTLAPPLDCVWQGVRVQSVGASEIDTVLTAGGVGGATTFIDATPTTLDANGELLLMKDGHRIYGNATFNSGTNRWKRATAGTDWMGYNSAVNGWQVVTDGVEKLRVSSDKVYVEKVNPASTDPSPTIVPNQYVELETGIGQEIRLVNQWGAQLNPFPTIASGDPRQGRTRASALRVSSVHSGEGDCYNISSNAYIVKTPRSVENKLAGDHNNIGLFNGQATAGSDQVTLYGMGDIALKDMGKNSVAMRGCVVLLTADGLNDQPYDGNAAYHADRFCYMGRSQGDSDIDVMYTAIGKSKAAFDCSDAVLSDNAALNMAPEHRIYYNAARATPHVGYVSPDPGQFWTGMSADGSAVEHSGQLNMPGLPEFANEAAAVSLNTGDIYKTATGELRIKL